MKGLIFNIKRYSVHDGPGIRVTIFLKGCPLNCLWCHNPEGISPSFQDIAIVRKVGSKSFTEKEPAGKNYSVSEIMEIVERERVFINNSGGGVTFSGGEPLLQYDFLFESLRAFREAGIHTAVDTSGYAPEESYRSLIPYTDLFMFDIKHLDNEKHLQYTGNSNSQVLSNYRFLAGNCRSLFIRIPVIPGINDDPGYLEELRDFIVRTRTERIKKICLLPFHKTGAAKYRNLGLEYRMNSVVPPSAERMKELQSFFSFTGIKVKIGG